MGITIKPAGGAALAAKAGQVIGKGQRAKEDRARAEREQARAAQEQARAAALQWEQEKMRMRSEQDFQQELASKQWDYEKFNRAKAWQIEKMEIASRNDFAQEEKERAEKQAKTAAGLKAIDDSANIYPTPEAKERAKEEFLFKQEQGYYPPRQTQGMTEREELEEYVGSFGREMDLPELREEAEVAGWKSKEETTKDLPGLTEELPAVSKGKVYMISPDGEIGTVDENEVQEYLGRGFKLREEETPIEEESVDIAQEVRDRGAVYGSGRGLLKSPVGMLLDYYNTKRKLPQEVKDRLKKTEQDRITAYYKSRGLK